IVQIVCESTLPEAAADYANTLAQEFIQQNLEERWAMYERTSSWLERAQGELKTKLEASEKQLLTYATESGLIVTSKEQDILGQRVVEMQSEMSRAQAQ